MSIDEREPLYNFDETALLQHYDLLKDIGVLDELEELRADVHFQHEIIDGALDIFKEQNISALMEYLISRILDKYVPANLVFLLKSQPHADDIECFTYKNLTKSDEAVEITSLRPFTEFFTTYKQPVSFTLFEHESPENPVLEELRRLDAEMLVPVLGPGGLLGVIIIGKKMVDGEYTNREIEYINRLMQFGSAALQNVIHYVSASRDQKTRLYNHSYFMNRLEEELRRFNRYGREFSVLICDLDHFKLVNDTYGHPAGDQILCDFARVLEASTRSVDVVARYGGEEFVALFPETTKEGVWATAERMRLAVQSHSFTYNGTHIAITCSIGVCHVASVSDANASDIVQAADSALYWAKGNGRNRSSLHGAGLYFMGRNYYR